MNDEALEKALLDHATWLRGEGGAPANLARANLTCANLARANLAGADLTFANLTFANLTCANLTRANLTGANLAGADLTRADLTRAQILCLPLHDPRGYRPVAVAHSDGWVVASGCRWLPLAQAREHWGRKYAGDRSIGDLYLAALDWLAEQPLPEIAA